MTELRNEIEKAVASRGEYRVVCHCADLACDNQKWFKMSEKRVSKISQLMKAPVTLDSELYTDSGDQHFQSTSLDSLVLPPHMKKTIWSRASSILGDNAAVINKCSW